MEPQILRCRHVGELADRVDRARVGRARDARDRERGQAGRAVPGDRLRDWPATQVERVVGRKHDQGLDREAQLVECPSDREVALIAGVHPGTFEVLAAGRSGQAADPAEAQVAGHGHRHEIGHDPTAGQQPERAFAIADEVAQPANDLLLDEGSEWPGVPDVDALVGDLGKQLAHDRHGQRRWREVAELTGMLAVHHAAPESIGELGDDIGGGRRRHGSR